MFLVQLLVLLKIDFISSASLVLYIIIVYLIGEERAGLYIFVFTELVHLYAPPFVFAHLALCQS